MSVIFLNVIAMACTHHDMDEDFSKAIDVTNFICTVFFVMEVIIKLIGLGCRNYFRVKIDVLCRRDLLTDVCLGWLECV